MGRFRSPANTSIIYLIFYVCETRFQLGSCPSWLSQALFFLIFRRVRQFVTKCYNRWRDNQGILISLPLPKGELYGQEPSNMHDRFGIEYRFR